MRLVKEDMGVDGDRARDVLFESTSLGNGLNRSRMMRSRLGRRISTSEGKWSEKHV